LKPNAMTSNLVPHTSLPVALILPIVESAAKLAGALDGAALPGAAAEGLEAPPDGVAPAPLVQAVMTNAAAIRITRIFRM
jgi:hypothetical protein